MTTGGWPFYALVECPSCDADVHVGVNVTFHEYRGLPAVPVDLLAGSAERCPSCGVTFYLGEVDAYVDEADDEEGPEL